MSDVKEKNLLDNGVPGPYRVALKAGRNYLWCACGRSNIEPRCDDSHVGSGIEPVSYKSPSNLTVALCGCKLTRNPPFCDGSHVHGEVDAAGRVVLKSGH